MKAWFNRPFTLRAWHVAAFVLAFALLIGTGVVVWAQESASRAPNSPPKMLKPGTIRLTAQNFTDASSVTCDDAFHTIATAGVKVLAGQKADVIATVNFEAFQGLGSGEYAYGKFVIDGTDLAPSNLAGMWVIDGNGPPYSTISQQGMTTTPVLPGNHYLYYMVRCTAGTLSVYDTIISAVVNIR